MREIPMPQDRFVAMARADVLAPGHRKRVVVNGRPVRLAGGDLLVQVDSP